MSGIDRIQGGQGPQEAGGPERASEPKKAAGDFGDRLQSEKRAERSEHAEGVGGQQFATLKQRILEGVEQNLDRAAILHNVIDDEVARSFDLGNRSKMSASITTAFQENEQLKALFDRLYAEATRDAQQA